MTGAERSHTVSWYIRERVLLIRLNGLITKAELQRVALESFEHIRRANHVIHAIVDLRKLDVQSNDVREAFQDAGNLHHKNQGTSVIIVSPMNPLIKFVTSSVMTLLRLKFDICDSFEEAEEKIAKLEAKRPTVGTK